MALCSLRLRRNLSTLYRRLSVIPELSSRPVSQSYITRNQPSISRSSSSQFSKILIQSRGFRASTASLLSVRSSHNSNSGIDEIGPDTILFEGCDYNHWLIVMDFPKQDGPTREQMIETYEQTCATGLNISVEEAKKRIYACSTTTYTGFQVLMSEEESQKFEGLPGVIFVLPDSYIDPQNKEYGGDKYENGVITPRPPPIQFRRNTVRYRDRNRNPEQPRYNQQGNSSWSPSYNSSQNYLQQQNYVPPSQNYPPQPNHVPPSQNHPQRQNYGPSSQNYPPQQNYGQPPQNYPPQQNYGPPSQNYPPQQHHGRSFQNYPQQQNHGPPTQNYPQQQNHVPPTQNYPQQQNHVPPTQNYPQQQNHVPPTQNYPQQQNPGPPTQNYPQQQNYGQPSQSYPPQGEQRTYPPSGHTANEQGRY